MKCGAFARKEEVQRFPHQYIEIVKSPNGHMLHSNQEICWAFRAHFHDRFAHCPDLPVQDFRSYLADFHHFQSEAASCRGLVTECQVCNELNQVGLNKSSGLDGCPTKCT